MDKGVAIKKILNERKMFTQGHCLSKIVFLPVLCVAWVPFSHSQSARNSKTVKCMEKC